MERRLCSIRELSSHDAPLVLIRIMPSQASSTLFGAEDVLIFLSTFDVESPESVWLDDVSSLCPVDIPQKCAGQDIGIVRDAKVYYLYGKTKANGSLHTGGDGRTKEELEMLRDQSVEEWRCL